MAEAWLEEEEEELREIRDPGIRRNRRGQMNAATDRAERNKPEQRLSSPGPLSSIRAAIKRTTTRANSQNDPPRDRRRPEITIVSAEPLVSNAWFSGAAGGFSSPHTPSQGIWGPSIPASAQPPPSYDQVIREKTQEQVCPAASPRPSTTTIATQTDLEDVSADAGLGGTGTPQPVQGDAVPAAGKPPKPPRPSLLPPKTKPVASKETVFVKESALVQEETTKLSPIVGSEQLADSQNSTTENRNNPIDSCSKSLLISVSNQCDIDPSPNKLCSDPTEFPGDQTESLVISTDPQPSVDPASKEETKRPVPRPRSKINLIPVTKEVKVQTLVRFKEDDKGEGTHVIPDCGELSSGTYLQELLEVFSVDDQNEEDNMNNFGSQRNIRAKIQAFESQVSTESGNGEPKKPEVRPRHQLAKPPVTAAKPTLMPKPSSRSFWEGDLVTAIKPSPATKDSPVMVLPKLQGMDNVFDSKPEASKSLNPNVVFSAMNNSSHLGNGSKSGFEDNQKEIFQVLASATKPLVPMKPTEMESKDAVQAESPVFIPPPRRLVASRAKSFMVRDSGAVLSRPTPPLLRQASLDLLTSNNQAATGFSFGNGTESESAEMTMTDFFSTKPQGVTHNVPSRPGVSCKPTMIRVPSKPGKMPEADQQDPPPLPVEKPVGGFTSSVTQKYSFASKPAPQESCNSEWWNSSSSEPCLPPRPSGGKVLPPRPPPAKGAPGRPPPPRTSAQPLSSKMGGDSGVPKQPQSQMSKKKGPVLPPRPRPGHQLYNNYTLSVPHGIAEYDFNGRNPGELSFQKNEVLVLLEQIDSDTFVCQAGDGKGTVPKSYMKIITPLPKVPSSTGTSQSSGPGRPQKESSGLQAQVLYDFTPESPDELALRAGDTVSHVERIDSEWYRGTCRGSSGIFPINYVKVLSSIPAPPNGKTDRPKPAPVSGPRCVARFDFEGEQSDELTFSEGDVIKLKEYVDQEWLMGEFDGRTGLVPLNFVEIVEDLPSVHSRVPLPGLGSSIKTNNQAVKASQSQAAPAAAEWGVALYDYTPHTEEDLSLKQGDYILITEEIDADWSRGRLNGKEGFFPTSYVQRSAGSPTSGNSQTGNKQGGRAKALFDFTSESEDELSMKAGDIITALESVDEEWFAGELRGKCGLVPKNYVQVLQEP
ncbi:SH3 domain-containing protein 19 isoform X2 [Lepisosteus oculatus]|uniref:SH3 domain-containing protein 19 isoform X2 n=1 Tax=Lepisosteus oculatus TaxID=7918 RepID=UPI00073FD372|nr:PREDICTED: SH3 domain-containing protein 19 isoform X2 [Lepisosteus oculatus]